MRRLSCLGLALAIGAGCATSPAGLELPTGQAAAHVYEWRQVIALDSGSRVLVEVDGVGIVDGRITAADDRELTLSTSGGPTSIGRSSIERVVAVRSLAGRGARQGAIVGAFVGGLLALATGGQLWQPLLGEPAFFAGIGAASSAFEHRQVLVYQRP